MADLTGTSARWLVRCCGSKLSVRWPSSCSRNWRVRSSSPGCPLAKASEASRSDRQVPSKRGSAPAAVAAAARVRAANSVLSKVFMGAGRITPRRLRLPRRLCTARREIRCASRRARSWPGRAQGSGHCITRPISPERMQTTAFCAMLPASGRYSAPDRCPNGRSDPHEHRQPNGSLDRNPQHPA